VERRDHEKQKELYDTIYAAKNQAHEASLELMRVAHKRDIALLEAKVAELNGKDTAYKLLDAVNNMVDAKTKHAETMTLMRVNHPEGVSDLLLEWDGKGPLYTKSEHRQARAAVELFNAHFRVLSWAEVEYQYSTTMESYRPRDYRFWYSDDSTWMYVNPLPRVERLVNGRPFATPHFATQAVDAAGYIWAVPLTTPAPEKLIFVDWNTPEGLVAGAEFKPSATIQDVKLHIEKEEGTLVALQRLFMVGEEKDVELLNGTLAENKVPDNVQIRMKRKKESVPIQIFVRVGGKTRTVATESSALVLTIKNTLKEVENIPVDKQRFIYAGRQLEDDFSLADYGIADCSTLDLILPLRGS
jgi:hypothetical protein